MSEITQPRANTKWISKFIESLFAATLLTNSLSFAMSILPEEWLVNFFPIAIVLELAIPIVFAIGFSIYWHRKEKKFSIDSDKIHAWLIGVIRYGLAFSISAYGFAKIFQTQFQHSIVRDDTLVGGLNGFALTWNFFGYSYTLAVILGLTQIIGSILLLFRKTTLLGVVVLLPVMINIVLINIFYSIAFGAFVNSILYSLGLIFLLLWRWHDLKRVFLDYVSPFPNVGYRWVIYLAKATCIIAAGALIGSFVIKSETPPKFVGKWNVDYMIKNGDTIPTGKWLTDSTAWTTVYIEGADRIYFCPNPYLYEKKRSLFLKYKFHSKTNEVSAVFNKDGKPIDTTNFKISKYSDDRMVWRGIFFKDTLEMKMSKVIRLKR